MRRSELVKVGANLVVEIEWDGADAPRLTFFRLEFSDAPDAEQVRALVAALCPKEPRP